MPFLVFSLHVHAHSTTMTVFLLHFFFPSNFIIGTQPIIKILELIIDVGSLLIFFLEQVKADPSNF